MEVRKMQYLNSLHETSSVKNMLNLFVIYPVGWWRTANFQNKLVNGRCISDSNYKNNFKMLQSQIPMDTPEIKYQLCPFSMHSCINAVHENDHECVPHNAIYFKEGENGKE